MTNISAPKIPDGEKVDFDVSWPPLMILWLIFGKQKLNSSSIWPWFGFLMAGHPQEASGEGSVWAAVSDWSSLHPEEERGRGAHRPRQPNRECVYSKRSRVCFCLENHHDSVRLFYRRNVALRGQSNRGSGQRERKRGRPDLRYGLSVH